MRKKIKDIVKKIFGPFKTKFEDPDTTDEIVAGYNIYMSFLVQFMSKQGSKFQLEQIYKKFLARFHEVEETKSFREFFEFCNTKTYSEAICESIGSIMNMATALGRNCHPANFNKEIGFEIQFATHACSQRGIHSRNSKR